MLNIFVNTWKNYNENGADGGQWVTLPHEDIHGALDEIATALGETDPEFAIHDYEYTTEIDLREISEMESIIALNKEIEKLAALDMHQQEVYCAAVEIWGQSEVNPENIDEYILHPDIHSDYDLGYYLIHETGEFNLNAIKDLSHYFNYEMYGRDVRWESDGGFSSFGWIEKC